MVRLKVRSGPSSPLASPGGSGRSPFPSQGTAATLLLAGALVALGALLFTRLRTPRAEASAGLAGRPPAADTGAGPRLDLDHLSDDDLAFLSSTLREGSAGARLSAARALAVSGDPRGAGILLDAAERGGEQADLYCMAALDVLRLQDRARAVRELLLAIEQRSLPAGCRSEVSDRFALAGGHDPSVIAGLATDPEAAVRSWVARALADQPGDQADRILAGLAADPDGRVRETARLALAGRGSPGGAPR